MALLYDLHRVFGAALLGVLVWKQAIVLPSLAAAGAAPTVGSVDRVGRGGGGCAARWPSGFGLAWTLNVITFDFFWGYSPMTVHVALGIGLLPLVAHAHAASQATERRQRTDSVAAHAPGNVDTWPRHARWAGKLIDRVAAQRIPAGERLATGSKHVASFSGNAYPAEIWLFDQVPLIDREAVAPAPDGARCRSRGCSATPTSKRCPRTRPPPSWTAPAAGGRSRSGRATASATWSVPRGVEHDVTEVAAVSVTGHRCAFPIADLEQALLVTHVGDEPLSPGHGYPVRLAVPGRRGYQWVKWLDRIEFS